MAVYYSRLCYKRAIPKVIATLAIKTNATVTILTRTFRKIYFYFNFSIIFLIQKYCRVLQQLVQTPYFAHV